jgi:hypothetical protein
VNVGPGYQPPSPIIGQILSTLGGSHQPPATQQPNFDLARAMLAHLAAAAPQQHVRSLPVEQQDNGPVPTNLGSVAAGLPAMYPGQGQPSSIIGGLLAYLRAHQHPAVLHIPPSHQQQPVLHRPPHQQPFTLHLPYLHL